MEWLNIKVSTLRSAEYLGSKPVERATWINVLAYCVDQENGGIITDAASWKDRQWQQCCGVTGREVRAASKLLKINGNDVHVFGYPKEKEEEVKTRRIQAADAARRRWDAKLGNASTDAPRNTTRNASRIPPRNAEREREREGEGEGEETSHMRDASSGELPLSNEPKTPKPETLTDAQWLATLDADPAYAGISVRTEHAKMIRWCEVNKRKPTRRRFVNWLNRCEKPMNGGTSEFKGAF